MASSPARVHLNQLDAGFATAAATLTCLALALVASALMADSLVELKRAKADMARDQVDYALSGAQSQAFVMSMAARMPERAHYSVDTAAGAATVLVENEARKVGVAAAAELDAGDFAKLGVTDIEALRSRLKSLSFVDALGPRLEEADTSPQWRACVRSVISPFGGATKIEALKPDLDASIVSSPQSGTVWHMRAVLRHWVDERIVRVSGDRDRPMAVIERRFYPAPRGGVSCDTMFTS